MGEASYLVKGGSAIRIDWKPKDPDVIKVYFHCQTSLIETFREIHRQDFDYQGKRAIVLPLTAFAESGPLKHCLQLALKYHRLKYLHCWVFDIGTFLLCSLKVSQPTCSS